MQPDDAFNPTAINPTADQRPSGAAVSLESAVADLWRTLLGIPESAPALGLDENFFEVGGTSLLATLLLKRINSAFDKNLPIASVFEHTTIRSQAALLRGEAPASSPFAAARESQSGPTPSSRPASESPAIAIIAVTGRFPGADSVEGFWQNLVDGVESITFFNDADLDPAERVLAQAARQNGQNYVPARPLLNNPDLFDADFFGVYPKEAAQMDPQHRIFLECAWELLERAGYAPNKIRESVGVFAGCSMNTYFMRNLAAQPGDAARSFLQEFTGAYQVGNYATMMGNDKDFLPTRISYKLNLHGPSISVQSACSTALVAVSQAAQSLLTGQCDMALAGAVSVTFPLHRGYLAQEGGLASLDGHCRPFDAAASGTVFGHGAGVVLLKRLDAALADGDQVLAVLRGFALNNDGNMKVGYTAPSVEGQAQVIARAQTMAGVPADSITYLEAHGTGTPVGDPIEVAALTRAFRASTDAQHFCSLGTGKANVGHLDVAAGATGLIKTVLQLQHRQIPGLLHFTAPNPELHLEGSPFFIDRELRAWDGQGYPLRAGVSAFGVGGTNAHLIVEEAPAAAPSTPGRETQLLLWSAKTPASLEKIGSALGSHFAQHPEINLSDAAYTLQTGRASHKLRRAAVVSSAAEAAQISQLNGQLLIQNDHPFDHPRLVFSFPGQGVQMVNMGRDLYNSEPAFREAFDACDAILTPLLGASLRELVYPENLSDETAREAAS
ncbi:MAG TPA: beta-ketoacyl synthase N-terminal-like domain-containing protein, partial [Acidobacteriaceae bacterium]